MTLLTSFCLVCAYNSLLQLCAIVLVEELVSLDHDRRDSCGDGAADQRSRRGRSREEIPHIDVVYVEVSAES